MSLSKCSRLFSTSPLVLGQSDKAQTSRVLKLFLAPRSWFFRKSDDLFHVDKNFDRTMTRAKDEKQSEEKKTKPSGLKFYAAIAVTSSVLIGTFFLFKWQIKSLLAKEDEAKGEVGY